MDVAIRLATYCLSICFVAGLAYAAIAFGARAKARAAQAWPTVRGHLVRPAGRSSWGELGGGMRYCYDSNGQVYEGGRVRFLDWPSVLWGDAREVRSHLLTDSVEVRVNPKLAEDAVLDVTPPPVRFGWAGLVLAAGSLALLLAIKSLAG